MEVCVELSHAQERPQLAAQRLVALHHTRIRWTVQYPFFNCIIYRCTGFGPDGMDLQCTSGLWSSTIGQVLKYFKYFGSSTSTSTLHFRQSSTRVHQVLTRQVQVQVHNNNNNTAFIDAPYI